MDQMFRQMRRASATVSSSDPLPHCSGQATSQFRYADAQRGKTPSSVKVFSTRCGSPRSLHWTPRTGRTAGLLADLAKTCSEKLAVGE